MRTTALLLTLLLSAAACSASSDEASVAFGNLSDGDEVTGPVSVEFVADDFTLEPGEHTLCLQAGNGAHEAPDLTDEVAITVVE